MVRHEVSPHIFVLLNLKKIFSQHLFVTQAAEAMGAISDPSSVPILKEYLTDPERSVRETCEIAVAKIEWDNSEEGKKHHASLEESSVPYVASRSYFPAFDKSLWCRLYTSVDPAPPSSGLLLGTLKVEDVGKEGVERLRKELEIGRAHV